MAHDRLSPTALCSSSASATRRISLYRTAGTFDLDAELDLWFSGLGTVRLEFKGKTDIRGLGQMIANYTLR